MKSEQVKTRTTHIARAVNHLPASDDHLTKKHNSLRREGEMKMRKTNRTSAQKSIFVSKTSVSKWRSLKLPPLRT